MKTIQSGPFALGLVLTFGFTASALAAGKAPKNLNCSIAYSGYDSEMGDKALIAQACSQAAENQFYKSFKLYDNWWETLGKRDRCNLSLPYARLLVGVAALRGITTSAAGFGVDAYGYVAGQLRQIRVDCAAGENVAAYAKGGTYQRNDIYLNSGFFQNHPLFRAGLLIHETRHTQTKHHDGKDKCPRKMSCDSSWAFNGANTYEVRYYLDIARNGTNLNTALRWRAVSYAQHVIDEAFIQRPAIDAAVYSGTRAAGLGDGRENFGSVVQRLKNFYSPGTATSAGSINGPAKKPVMVRKIEK